MSRNTPNTAPARGTAARPFCTESLKAVDERIEPSVSWTCVRCLRKPLYLRRDGHKLLVPKHREWADPSLVAMVIAKQSPLLATKDTRHTVAQLDEFADQLVGW